MKKILLSLCALFAVSIASAQSYAKQPDPSTYEVVEYKQSNKTSNEERRVEGQDKAQPAQEKTAGTATAITEQEKPDEKSATLAEIHNKKRK